MITALSIHETLDAAGNYVALAGALILLLTAAVVISTLVFEGMCTFRTFQALSKLT